MTDAHQAVKKYGVPSLDIKVLGLTMVYDVLHMKLY